MMKRFIEQISLEEMHDEIKREIKMRQRVYPQWIIAGKIASDVAAFRVLVLEAIQSKFLRELKEVAPQQDLFQ
ncbi:MAG: hypothetical protein H0U50_05475 [Pyrinomonadaceae bacterium]|nr:hypothetical protein [Pyrinomonadaceae bacterium]